MRLVSLVLLITFESLFVNYASSRCVSLNNTLLNNCFQAGFNESEFTKSRPLQNISNLIMSMKTKFDSCSSSLSTLMTCSLHVPRCSNTSSRKLPSREECKNFVSGCKDVSVDTEGLMALFRGLCDLLPSCASPPDRLNITAEDYVSCKPLSIKQCAGAGYTSTTVSQLYQKLVSESSAIFQNSSSNSTLRKIICMEVAPPCDHKNISTLYVPCKSTCENAYNESTFQFLDAFRSLDYCSVFPTMTKSYPEQEYCAFQAWPKAGYWPSGLWKFLVKAEPNKTIMDTSTPTATSAPTMATNNRTDYGTITEPAHSSTPVTHPEASPTIMAQGSTEGESMETTSAPILVLTATVSEESTTIVTTSVEISPTASSSAASENEGNTTTPTSVSATITLGGTSTALVSTVKASPTATVATPAISKTEIHGSRNRTVTTNLKASSTASSAKSGSSTSAKTVSSTTVHGSITVTSLTNSTVSRPAVRSTTGSEIRQSKTVPMTVTTIMVYGTPSVSSTATKGKAPGVQVKTGKKLSAGAIAGIVLGVLVGLAVIVFVGIGFKKYSKRRAQYRHSLMVDMDEL